MALSLKIVTALSATAAAGTAAAFFVVNSHDLGSAGSRGSGPPASAALVQGDGITLCVEPGNGTLRVPPEFGRECPAGQRTLHLPAEDEAVCELCDPFSDGQSEPMPDNAAVAALERRVRNLENTAYFEVVSQKDEHVIFRAGPGGARLFNSEGRAVAAIGTGAEGSFLTTRSTVSGAEASIGAAGRNGGVRFVENGVRLELATREGPYALRVPSARGLIAGLGQSRAGSGAVIVGSLPGVTQGLMIVSDGRPMVSLSSSAGAGGVTLAEATIGGGLLDVANSNGDSAVKMGHNSHRYGIVLAGPVPGIPFIPRSGLPGSYFMGCASGEKPACIPNVAGQ